MSGITKLMTAGGGGVALTPASSIASDVTVQVPSQDCTLGIQGPAFSAYKSAAQTGMSSGVSTKITFDTEAFDTNNNFASSRFTPTVAGYYQINASVGLVPAGASSNWISIYKNGSEIKQFRIPLGGAGNLGLIASDVISMNGSTDYLEIYTFSNGGTYQTDTNLNTTWFSGCLVRAA